MSLKRISKKVKINSRYYQEEILEPYFREDIPTLYPNQTNQVELHQDKASSHTSNSTRLFLEKMANDTGIRAIPFEHIPVKSPDAAPMDYCAFGLLKQALGRGKPKTLNGLWKAVEEEWCKLSIVTLRRALFTWKQRCRMIVKEQGYQIEHLK